MSRLATVCGTSSWFYPNGRARLATIFSTQPSLNIIERVHHFEKVFVQLHIRPRPTVKLHACLSHLLLWESDAHFLDKLRYVLLTHNAHRFHRILLDSTFFLHIAHEYWPESFSCLSSRPLITFVWQIHLLIFCFLCYFSTCSISQLISSLYLP